MRETKAIAIGGFDGMHIGHQALFVQLQEGDCIVVIETGYANLTPQKYREFYTQHKILYLDLQEIKHLDGAGFMALLGEYFPHLEKIVVGYDFHFGKDRCHSYEDLKRLFAGEVLVVEEVKYKEESVHSRTIREKLREAKIENANSFLGRNYSLWGKFIKGQGLGAKELVATINLENSSAFLLPKAGVYATLTRVDDEEHFRPSVSFLGHRVSTDGSYAIETHILDESVVCKECATISFVSYLRENRKFDSLESLKEAINADIKRAKKRLNFLRL